MRIAIEFIPLGELISIPLTLDRSGARCKRSERSSMDYLPQIVGQKCSRCQRTISSIAEGHYCPVCFSPFHNRCRSAVGSPLPDGSCLTCGADPRNDATRKIQAEVREEMAKEHTKLACPNCGNTHGFKPYGNQMDSDSGGVGLVLISLPLFLIVGIIGLIVGLGRLASKGEYECLKCGHVFNPIGSSSSLGCLLVALLGCGAVAVIFWTFFQ